MTAPELKRYYADKRDIWEDNDVGEYVRFADVEAYTQAAIAAAMMGAADKVSAGLTNLLYSETCADIAVDLIMGCVPTDATAALEEIKRQVRNQALEEAACVLDHFHSDDTHTTIAVIWQDEIRALKGKE